MKLMFTLSDTTQIIHRKIQFCIPSCSAPNEPSFESPGKPWQALARIERKKSKTFSSSSKNFGSKNPTKGGGARFRAPPPPLVGFARPKIDQTGAEVLDFSFQSFRACQGSQNWAHWVR